MREFTVKMSILQVEYAGRRVKMGFLGIISILVSLYDTCDRFVYKKSNRNDKFIVFAESRLQVGTEKLCSWI